MPSALSDHLKEHVNAFGYCRVSNAKASDFLALAKQWGVVVADPRTGADVRDLRPQPADSANPNTLSSRYGLGAFPFHTEAAYLSPPPTIVILYCEAPGNGGRSTYLIDTAPLIGMLSASVRRGSWIVRSGRTPFLAHLVEVRMGNLSFQYDADCMMPLSRSAWSEQATVDQFLTTAPRIELKWNAGDMTIINNTRMLHGRGSSSTADDSDRVLKRIMIRG